MAYFKRSGKIPEEIDLLNNINTGNHHLRPNANLSCFQRSTFYAGKKIFNRISPGVTNSQK
jgi:hypothetical protein